MFDNDNATPPNNGMAPNASSDHFETFNVNALDDSKVRIALMDEFPDFNAPGFDIVRYNQRFHNANIVIKASSAYVGFPEHWGGLSVKCASGGYEYYESGDDFFAVNASNYLVFNEGRIYSSFIDSKSDVESFTINFTPELERMAWHTFMSSATELLDNPARTSSTKFRLTERLADHDTIISPLVHKLHALSRDWANNHHCIQENLLLLLEALICKDHANKNGAFIQAVKSSTRHELVKRLMIATDYLEANYNQNVSVDDLADVACMNSFYFLRQFKKFHGVTPHHFLQRKRMSQAAVLLRREHHSVVDVCNQVGFVDPVSFGKLFRRYFEQTPGEFRAMYRRKK
jgi:AraC family transcriptional regulator